MRKNASIEQQTDAINNLCVKTYMELLGYGCVESARLYVDHDTNRFRLSDKKLTGGVLDLASALFLKENTEILKNICLYRIDQLLIVCGNRAGSFWHALRLRTPEINPQALLPPWGDVNVRPR